MGDEIYFRGETTNHKPANPKQYAMDYGDALYLTDNAKTAEVYAQIRVNEKGGEKVIKQVTIKSGELGRVLDLSTDPRWAKFLDTPIAPGRKETTPRVLMKTQQSNYTLFQMFLKQNNIDITQYNAVKGPEGIHGGTQLAILHKNGSPSPQAVAIQARMTPVGPGGPKVPFGTRVALTARSVGGGMVMLALSILMAWVRGKIDKQWIEKGLIEIEPQIWVALFKRVPLIADLMAKGRKAYANVTIEISQRKEAAAGIDFVDAIPVVRLKFVDVTGENMNAEGVMKSDSGYGYSKAIVPYIFSFEVTTPSETVKVWKEFKDEWEWYEDQMKKAPSAALSKQQDVLREEIVRVFGQEANLVLNAWMWPKFKFKTAP